MRRAGAERLLEPERAVERRRPPEAVDVADGVGNRDLRVRRDLLEDQVHREERREVVGADGLAGAGMQNRLRPVRHVGRDVVPALGDRALGQGDLRLGHARRGYPARVRPRRGLVLAGALHVLVPRRPGDGTGARRAWPAPRRSSGRRRATRCRRRGCAPASRSFSAPASVRLRVDDPAVGVAEDPLDEPRALEPLEQARDAGGGQEDRLGEVDAAHPLLGRAREVEQDLVVVEREPVLGDEVGGELAGQRSVGAQEADPGVQPGRVGERLRSTPWDEL